jgi:hypothetical protein
MASKIFEEAINNISTETEARVRLSVEIVEHISSFDTARKEDGTDYPFHKIISDNAPNLQFNKYQTKK